MSRSNRKNVQFVDDLFLEANDSWDVNNLYKNLTQVKQVGAVKKVELTAVEKTILRGLLCGYSPQQIANEIHWTSGSISVELTKGLYRYIETLTERDLNTLKNWRDVVKWLEEARYKIFQPQQDSLKELNVSRFYGREEELQQLKEWIVEQRYRLVLLSGITGIGKTTLAAKLAKTIQPKFDYVFWKTIRSDSSLSSLLNNLLKFFTGNQQNYLILTINEQISLLMRYLSCYHCLLIFDGLEVILEANKLAGFYQENYTNYSQLLKRIAEESHQSCLLITSQDEPADLFLLQQNPIKSLSLGSLGTAAKEIFREQGLAEPHLWQYLIIRYSGNPLVLKLIAAIIKDIFGGNISDFLGMKTEIDVMLPTLFKQLLSKQFERLSMLEKKVMYCLASHRQSVTLKKLQEYIKPPVYLSDLTQALVSLKRRSLIEVTSLSNKSAFTLQPLVMKYVFRESQRFSV
ncbi:WD-40 repeat-containing protein [Stanieria sp. NIES-3757]|nr:WD-40 repeat-containing protein [Stanieria sp. NIES-3757]